MTKIPFPDFEKLDLRVGKIVFVEDHPKADKLYVLTVDLGEPTNRTIVAGLKPYYKKEELKNRHAVFVANLEPINLRGVESNGMILAVESHDKTKVCFLTPSGEIEIGSKIR